LGDGLLLGLLPEPLPEIQEGQDFATKVDVIAIVLQMLSRLRCSIHSTTESREIT
jgi:hypothetical protein